MGFFSVHPIVHSSKILQSFWFPSPPVYSSGACCIFSLSRFHILNPFKLFMPLKKRLLKDTTATHIYASQDGPYFPPVLHNRPFIPSTDQPCPRPASCHRHLVKGPWREARGRTSRG